MTARASSADLGERILAQLAGHDSKRPARADDVAALIGGCEHLYWAAIERLKGTSQINCAHIKRGTDPEPWLAIWPTGARPRMDSWHALNARGHFTTTRTFTPQRLPQSIAARRAAQEIEMKQSPTATQQRRQKIADLVAGRPLTDGLPLKALAAELDITVEGVRHLIKSMLGGQRVALGKLPKDHGHRAYDPAAEQPTAEVAAGEPFAAADTAPGAEPEPEVLPAQTLEPADLSSVADFLASVSNALGDMEPDDPAPPTPPQTNPARISFALWDDGGLSIYDGDELLQIAPADVARLARLLGVPHACEVAA